ncbi:MAG: hypothetical protein ABI461_00830 [Polyangiaceae bacterium]
MKLNFAVFLPVFALVGSASSVAFASPRPLPFTYPYATLGKGEAEVETYADLTPVRVVELDNPTKHDWYGATQFQVELEYGITDRLELGLYVTWVPQSGSVTEIPALTEGNGTKQRLRLRLAEPGEWPVDVSLYGEVVESDLEIELEGKINLEKDFGKLAIMANLWAEREYELAGEKAWVANPTAGVTYQVTPWFHPGAEAWMRAEFADQQPTPRPFRYGPHVYVGPTLNFNFGKIWWSLGAYGRISNFDRTMNPGDPFGNIWMRTVIGVEF